MEFLTKLLGIATANRFAATACGAPPVLPTLPPSPRIRPLAALSVFSSAFCRCCWFSS